MGLVIPQFEAVRDTDPILYEGLKKLVKYVSGISNELRTAPVATPGATAAGFAFGPPLPPSAFVVTPTGNGYNLVITPNSGNSPSVQYFAESSALASFAAPAVYPLGTASTATIAQNPVANLYWRVRAKYPQSDYSPYLYAAGASQIAAGWISNGVDGVGNLILKTIGTVSGSTSGPTISSNTPAVIPEMTQTTPTKGNKVLIVFCGTFQITTNDLFLQLYMDGAPISLLADTSPSGAKLTVSLTVLIQPAAGNHTFDVRWSNAGSGGTLGSATALATNRTFQVVELG